MGFSTKDLKKLEKRLNKKVVTINIAEIGKGNLKMKYWCYLCHPVHFGPFETISSWIKKCKQIYCKHQGKEN